MKLTLRYLITLLFLVFSCYAIAVDEEAVSMEQATKAYKEKNYETSFKIIKPLAEKGNPKAQYNLGLLYYDGDGVLADTKEAIKWYSLAANQGNANAQHSMGYAYENGYGVEQDYAEAMKWYKLAANQGYGFSQYNLGVFYHGGRGVQQDYAEAIKWYKLAANQHVYQSEFNIGKIYEKGGFGVQQDKQEALKWYKLAAEHGIVNAQYVLGISYIKGEIVKRDINEAIKLLTPVANQGYQEAQNDLGFAYFLKAGMSGFGPDTPQPKRDALKNDIILAYAWCNIAIQNGENERAERLLTDLKQAMKPSEISEAEDKSKELVKAIKKPSPDNISWWIEK